MGNLSNMLRKNGLIFVVGIIDNYQTGQLRSICRSTQVKFRHTKWLGIKTKKHFVIQQSNVCFVAFKVNCHGLRDCYDLSVHSAHQLAAPSWASATMVIWPRQTNVSKISKIPKTLLCILNQQSI